MPKLLLRLSRFFHSGRSHSPKPLQGDPVAAAQWTSGDSASQLTHDSQPVTLLARSDSAPDLDPHCAITPPPSNPSSPSQTTDSNPVQHQDQLIVSQRSHTACSQPSPPSQPPTPPLYQRLPQLQDGNPGVLNVQNTRESRNVSVGGTANYVNYTNTVVNSSTMFMEKLLEKTIPGAAFDSSARDPPPRCHPGTRLAILARCLEFIANAVGEKRVLCLFGAAGVGKSAIMQSVAESPLSSVSKCVSIFFSINGRNDGSKSIITLVYQLAAQSEPYRQFAEREILRDPSLLLSSLSVQFKKFVVEPFTNQSLINSIGRVLIIIDGLDECNKSNTQLELLRLISYICSTYPSSPLVWIMSSRPESHITSFFSRDHVKAVYEKEEIVVDSDEARGDVEKFLRNELTMIQTEYCLNPQWPGKQDFWKLANASGGLFVFADTVIKYIGDRAYGDPTTQLNDVLKAIDAHTLPNVPKEDHPMARLDALYAQILSNIPARIMVNTRKILLALVLESRNKWRFEDRNFLVFCNWLGMTCDEAYAAIRHLCSVLDTPPRNNAHRAMLRFFHKSFIDYISDFARSGFSSDIKSESQQLEVQCTFRILEQAPDGIDSGGMNDIIHGSVPFGALARGPGTGGNISLAWPVDEEIGWSDNRTRVEMYKLAVSNVVEGIKQGESAFSSEFCIRLVTSRFRSYGSVLFPYQELRNLVFERSRHHEFIKHGILKEVPIRVLRFTDVVYKAWLQFRRPTGTAANLSDPWNTSCKHNRAGDWEESKDEDWTTEFGMSPRFVFHCPSCCERLEKQLDQWKTRSPDHPARILFTSTRTCFVEFQFIDPDDGASEWTYWLVHEISKERRRDLGSTV